ncbi:Ig-like domain-containing protein [Anaerocolumna sp. AGMB13025]|uniref:Ig-like domain-containing protein n=1 Tax=Anaerocolumna sp. AGMB13025 TaxID=3039116 RepID=UPI00241C1092|nr:Ig-like domain-containing protein [Anaerocolumna sp. AGMB13025]WFR56331.1 Ig-like domain-containing protein [Anaerocolumna sp. AGMB13025]
MRKNFFKKKLASTLALAMVVTSLAVPTSASAATATKIVKQGGAAAPTVLYVGEKGTDYGLSKVVKGNKYTWTTSNSKIATINKSGVVTAKAPGKVTIKVTARDSKGKWLSAFTKKLTINQRATSIDIGADDFKLVIGQDKDLNAVKTPAKSTDTVKYVSDNTAVATVNAKSGVVKAVGVGEATITVLSKATSASADTSKYNKKDTVKVTVADGIQSVKQTTPSKIEVTFATDQSKSLTADALTVTDKDGVKQIIKSLSFSADGKTATVEFYLNLSDAATYKVAYGTTDKTFTASVGDVASISLTGKTVQYAKATTIDVKLLDKNGVDVTGVKSDYTSYITFDVDNSLAYVNLNNDNKYQITVYDFPKSVNVTATYHTYKYTDGEESTFKSSAVFNSVEEIKDVASDIKYTLATSDGPNWDKVNTTIPATAEKYQVFIKAKDAATDNDIDQTDFTFESSDTSILSVSSTGEVYAIKAGTAYIKATYGATSKMLAVTVGSESKVISVVPDSSVVTFYYVNAATNGATVGFVDSTKTITLKAEDQYGNEVAVGTDNVDVELISSNLVSGNTAAVTASGSGKTVTITGNVPVDKNNDGNYSYKLTYKGKSTVVNIKAVEVSNTVLSYINFDAPTTTLDAVIKGSTPSVADKTLTLYRYNKDAQQIGKVTGGVSYTITRDGNSVTPDGVTVATAAGAVTVTALALDTTSSPNVATQAAAGTYLIKAEESGTGRKASATVVVKNSQVLPTVKLDDSTISQTEGDILKVIKAAYTVSAGTIVNAEVVLNNAKVTTSLGSTSVSKGDSLLVKSITIEHTNYAGSGYTLRQKISVSGIGSITIVE